MLYIAVAPCAGAWVEIMSVATIFIITTCRSLWGAWIEIPATPIFVLLFPVTSYAGAWVEITRKKWGCHINELDINAKLLF